MILTISTTHTPATDLGYLLHKHPDRIQRFKLTFGAAHVFYPEVGDDRCTAALLLDVDPIDLARGKGPARGSAFSLYPYVNDRPYVASSFMSVAIAEVFGTALSGRCTGRPELAELPIPLAATIAALPCRGGEEQLRRLFEPLGYEIVTVQHPLDERFPEWGMSNYFTVELRGTLTLRELLAHLYVLIPVLDAEKHYWVGDDEVAKLLRHGEGWLNRHPARELIAKRYLKHRHSLASMALARLAESDPDREEEEHNAEEKVLEKRIGLHAERLAQVAAILKESGAARVLDLGCGEGKLLKLLLNEKQFTEIIGVDVSHRDLSIAAERLKLAGMPEMQRSRITLLHGSLIYRDDRLAGYDAAAVVEVIEHLDPFRLESFERVLFQHARPATVVITTPNREYNAMWTTLPAGTFRHKDHRFEWSREEFESWAGAVAGRHGYGVRFMPVGPADPLLGAPTQMGVFTR
jgi:3' terminal RNA ribose 2'-O-methyltransferase Hen1